MIKCVLAIVLLHLCSSSLLNIELSGEIIHGLEELNRLYKEGNLSIPEPLSLNELHSKPSHCAGVLVKTLKEFLGNVTIGEEHNHVVQLLRANLDSLPSYPENDRDCKVKKNPRRAVFPFKQFINCFKKLSSMKG